MWLDLYQDKKYDEIVRDFIGRIDYLNNDQIWKINFIPLKPKIFKIINSFLTLYTNNEFQISPALTYQLIKYNYLIFTLSKLSDVNLKNYITLIQNQDLLKILPLLSPLLDIDINYEMMFKMNKYWTSYWYEKCSHYIMEIFTSNSEYSDRINKHFNSISNVDYYPIDCPSYVLSTYLTKDISKMVKETINNKVQLLLENVNVVNKPRNKHIGLFGRSRYFFRNKNPVYKYIKHHINALIKNNYIITIVVFDNEYSNNGEYGNINVIKIEFPQNDNLENYNDLVSKMMNIKDIENMDKILNNTFESVYFVAVGDSIESIYLSNLQLATIQFSSYGHPISSHGSKNNYFMCGEGVESDTSMNDYSENVILLSNLVSKPIIPKQDISLYEKTDKRIINLGWTYKKINVGILNMISRIDEKYDDLLFVIHTGPCGYYPLHLNHIDENISRYIKRNMYRLIPSLLNVEDYYAMKKKSYIALDCYPYGGFTTIFENLCFGVPIITIKGEEAYNRLGATILSMCHMDELVVMNMDEMYEKVVFMLNHEGYVNSVRDKISLLDMDNILGEVNYGDELVETLDELSVDMRVKLYYMEGNVNN